jgi:hypothetical protein
MKSRFAVATAVLLSSCGSLLDFSSETDEASATASKELTADVVLRFNRDWTVSVSAPLVVGSRVHVEYDTARFPECRQEQDGRPLWSVTGHWMLGEQNGSLEAGGHSPSNGTLPPIIELTRSGDLSLYFQVTNATGCTAWDSNYGRNFHFQVLESGPRVRFLENWRTAIEGQVAGAETVTFEYDSARLPDCRAGYAGHAAWSIIMWHRFDGGPAHYVDVTRPSGTKREPNPVNLAVPAGAHELEVWFQNSDRAGCLRWDSKYGQNYRFQF